MECQLKVKVRIKGKSAQESVTKSLRRNVQSILGFKQLANLNPLSTSVFHHIETSQLICIANQLIGFYMRGNIDH